MITKSCVRCSGDFQAKRADAKYCSKECRETHWASNNRERLNATTRRYRARRYEKEGRWRETSPKVVALREWMLELKSKPCHDCGGTFQTCCMDFDHRPGTEKKYCLGSMFAHHYSRELIEIELAKCDLVCSNCHRIRTRDRRTGSGKHRRKDTVPAVSENTQTQ